MVQVHRALEALLSHHRLQRSCSPSKTTQQRVSALPDDLYLLLRYTAVDCWSVGTILAELLGSKPIFKGRDYVDQLNQVSNGFSSLLI